MTENQRARLVTVVRELPGALMLSFMTAVLVVIFAILVSTVTGAESRRLFAQSVANGEEVVDHAIIARCETAQIVDMLLTIASETSNEALGEALSQYPKINTEGLDCETIISTPFRPGNDFGLEGPEGSVPANLP